MSHFITDTLPMIGFGIAGILVMAFIKMNDINNRNESYTFGIVWNLFLRREWPSYGLSIIVVFITAFTHDEWIVWFTGEKIKIDVPIGVKLGMVVWGAFGQYLIYKRFGKMAKQVIDN